MVDRHAVRLPLIESSVNAAGLRIESMLIQPGYVPDRDRMELTLGGIPHDTLHALADTLRRLPGVYEINLPRLGGRVDRLAS